MSDYARVVDFIHEMYGSSEFVPLSVPKFIGNEKKYLSNVLIRHLSQALANS